eukprot:CAMPEP_0196586072 /NCGR_PEP_ID=MMETSP1081-20130531/53018_1 /TAXON_ID=36882 /ORGANISM="Pyramimonas amylifera, Strain CCMP720" /LENGTH=201 /DNA_ID=CAMNT_0041907827 /DNA_START=211 /DNA_END=813 /DNA_ORIENTATION=-
MVIKLTEGKCPQAKGFMNSVDFQHKEPAKNRTGQQYRQDLKQNDVVQNTLSEENILGKVRKSNEELKRDKHERRRERERKRSWVSAAGMSGGGKVVKRGRAYLLSNALPLLVGTGGWAYLEATSSAPFGFWSLLNLTFISVVHLGIMVMISILFTHNRARDTPPASWHDLHSAHGLLFADTVTLTIVTTRASFEALPAFDW